MSGWMLPNTASDDQLTPSDAPDGNNQPQNTPIPIPVHCAPLTDKESSNAKEQCLIFDPLGIDPIYKEASNQPSQNNSPFANIFSHFM